LFRQLLILQLELARRLYPLFQYWGPSQGKPTV